MPWSFLEELDPNKYGEVPFFREQEFRYTDFAQFEKILIDHALEVFKSADDYYKVASSIFQSALSHNVRYLETSFHAGMIEFLKIQELRLLTLLNQQYQIV